MEVNTFVTVVIMVYKSHHKKDIAQEELGSSTLKDINAALWVIKMSASQPLQLKRKKCVRAFV